MITVLLVVHLLVTLTLIATVLVQRSEGGGLGIGSSQGMGSFMSGRGTANLLTRTTGILAALFMALSLALAVLNRGNSGHAHDNLGLPAAAPSGTSGLPAAPLAATPVPGVAPAPLAAPVPGTAPTTGTVPGTVPGTPPAAIQTPNGAAIPAPVPGSPSPKH